MDEADIGRYIDAFEEKYKETDDAIVRLLSKYPKNNLFEEVFAKACTLNFLYSAGIRKNEIVKLSEYICKNNTIDEYLQEGSLEAFNIISNTPENIDNATVFASKYCHFHNPDKYPIFDSHSWHALHMISTTDDRFTFKLTGKNIRSNYLGYQDYYKCMEEFKRVFNLTDYSYKKIDEFLWMYGREI